MKIARVESEVSQEQLAEIVGVTRQTINLIESGNYNPSIKLCIAICKALNKTLNDLFWEE
jgi:putative transcriptional regulator